MKNLTIRAHTETGIHAKKHARGEIKSLKLTECGKIPHLAGGGLDQSIIKTDFFYLEKDI